MTEPGEMWSALAVAAVTAASAVCEVASAFAVGRRPLTRRAWSESDDREAISRRGGRPSGLGSQESSGESARTFSVVRTPYADCPLSARSGAGIALSWSR